MMPGLRAVEGMNAERLLENFDRVADAPNAVPRLRRFVLDLAVRGKLVEQDPADEPASELLKLVEVEKARLVKVGVTRRPKAPTVLDREIFPFALPKTWAWTRIAALGVISPRNDFPDDHLASFIPMRMIPAEYGDSSKSEIRLWGEIKKGYTHFAEGDVGLAKITPCFENGKSVVFRNLTGGIGSGTTELHVVRPICVDADYIVLFLKSPLFIENGIQRMTGTAGQKRVPREYFANSPFPLPPLAEQRRIVVRVDDAMALCDRLEETRTARENTRDLLTKASYARLSAFDTDDLIFRSHTRFTFDTFPALTSRATQVERLRQIILDLALRGKLVEQNPEDEPPPHFDPAIPHDLEPPFPVPPNWCWSRLRALGLLKGGGTPSKARDDFWNGSIPWVSPKDMKVDYIEQSQLNITEAAIKGSAVKLIEAESILFVVRGMILAHSFPVAISCVPLTINQDMKAVTLKIPDMAEYLLCALKGLKHEVLKRVKRSSHGTCRIESRDYRDLMIPIPPLAEQYRIVAKVDELMSRCDGLETSLGIVGTDQHRVLESFLQEALVSPDPEIQIA